MSIKHAVEFDAERTRLTSIAARILASTADADDIVQEAWLRLSQTDDVENLPAWLTTVVTRLCLDQLRKQRTRTEREAASLVDGSPVDPEADALIADAVGGAMQVMLETLAPAERAAFVLHDVFEYPFDDVGAILGRSTTAARQLASRARRKLHGEPEPVTEQHARAENRRVVDAFLAAALGGDLLTLLSLLAPEAIMRADLAGQQMGAAAVYDGPDAIASRFNGVRGAAPVVIDGERGAAWFRTGTVRVAFTFHVEGRLVREIELIGDPDVLSTLDIVRSRHTR